MEQEKFEMLSETAEGENIEQVLKDSENKKQPEKINKGWEALTIIHDFSYLLAAITLIFVFCVRLVGVSGSSMFPTFVDKDYLILESNFLYRTAKAGDIVVMNVDAFADEGPIVKRIIATEGQTVDIDFDNGIVYVDGEEIEEDYIYEPTYESYADYGLSLDYPVTVPEGCVFVMGDNRNHSADSRYSPVGCVPEEQILGKVLFLIFPGQETDCYGTVTGGRDFGRLGVVSHG